MYHLTPTQREILEALISLYMEKNGRRVTSKELAERLGKDEGTIRNTIGSLKALGLVESKTGPNGGYIPTIKALELMKLPLYVNYGAKLYRNGVETNIYVVDIEFIDLVGPKMKAIVRVAGHIHTIYPNDSIRIGPTANMRMVIEGIVTDKDVSRRELVIEVTRIVSIPNEPVKNFMSCPLITIDENATVRESLEILHKYRIRAAPVMSKDGGRILGIASTTNLLRAVLEGKLDAPVKDYVITDIATIDADADILEAIKKMFEYRIGRLIVVDRKGKPIGIVTRTDILRKIAGLMY